MRTLSDRFYKRLLHRERHLPPFANMTLVKCLLVFAVCIVRGDCYIRNTYLRRIRIGMSNRSVLSAACGTELDCLTDTLTKEEDIDLSMIIHCNCHSHGSDFSKKSLWKVAGTSSSKGSMFSSSTQMPEQQSAADVPHGKDFLMVKDMDMKRVYMYTLPNNTFVGYQELGVDGNVTAIEICFPNHTLQWFLDDGRTCFTNHSGWQCTDRDKALSEAKFIKCDNNIMLLMTNTQLRRKRGPNKLETMKPVKRPLNMMISTKEKCIYWASVSVLSGHKPLFSKITYDGKTVKLKNPYLSDVKYISTEGTLAYACAPAPEVHALKTSTSSRFKLKEITASCSDFAEYGNRLYILTLSRGIFIMTSVKHTRQELPHKHRITRGEIQVVADKPARSIRQIQRSSKKGNTKTDVKKGPSLLVMAAENKAVYEFHLPSGSSANKIGFPKKNKLVTVEFCPFYNALKWVGKQRVFTSSLAVTSPKKFSEMFWSQGSLVTVKYDNKAKLIFYVTTQAIKKMKWKSSDKPRIIANNIKPMHVELDESERFVYWSEQEAGSVTFRRVDYTGSKQERIVVLKRKEVYSFSIFKDYIYYCGPTPEVMKRGKTIKFLDAKEKCLHIIRHKTIAYYLTHSSKVKVFNMRNDKRESWTLPRDISAGHLQFVGGDVKKTKRKKEERREPAMKTSKSTKPKNKSAHTRRSSSSSNSSRSRGSRSNRYTDSSRSRGSRSNSYKDSSRSRGSRSNRYTDSSRSRRSRSNSYKDSGRSRDSRYNSYGSSSRSRDSRYNSYSDSSRSRDSRYNGYGSSSRSRDSRYNSFGDSSRSRGPRASSYGGSSRSDQLIMPTKVWTEGTLVSVVTNHIETLRFFDAYRGYLLVMDAINKLVWKINSKDFNLKIDIRLPGNDRIIDIDYSVSERKLLWISSFQIIKTHLKKIRTSDMSTTKWVKEDKLMRVKTDNSRIFFFTFKNIFRASTSSMSRVFDVTRVYSPLHVALDPQTKNVFWTERHRDYFSVNRVSYSGGRPVAVSHFNTFVGFTIGPNRIMYICTPIPAKLVLKSYAKPEYLWGPNKCIDIASDGDKVYILERPTTIVVARANGDNPDYRRHYPLDINVVGCSLKIIY